MIQSSWRLCRSATIRRWRRGFWRRAVRDEMGAFGRRLRARSYDFVLDTQGLIKSALIATTTSSLSVTELSLASGHHDRFFGFHVFNPVTKMALVELIFPTRASDDTRERAVTLTEALGKTPVVVPDMPGFVVNRLLFPYLFSAVELLDETGMTPADVDRCMTLGAGQPLGPLALLDFVGLDVALAIGHAIDRPVPLRLRALVDDGMLGRKTGKGFHSYPSARS